MIIAGAVPYATGNKRNKEFLNEVILMFVMYNVMCFSPFLPDLQTRSNMGFFCCIVVAFHLIVNLYFIGSEMIRDAVINFKFFRARRHLRRQRPKLLALIKTRKRRDPKADPYEQADESEEEQQSSDSSEVESSESEPSSILRP